MLLYGLQSWPKKFVLGCVILPTSAVARSRNLGQTFLANSVHTCRCRDHRSRHEISRGQSFGITTAHCTVDLVDLVDGRACVSAIVPLQPSVPSVVRPLFGICSLSPSPGRVSSVDRGQDGGGGAGMPWTDKENHAARQPLP